MISTPLAMPTVEYIAKLIGWSLGEKGGFTPILQIVIRVLLFLFVFGMAIAVMFDTTGLLTTLTTTLPSAIVATVIANIVVM